MLLRMLFPVFAVKILSFALIVLLGIEDNFLRQGLVLLPSYFIEGLILSRLLRKEFDAPDVSSNIYGGAIVYVLIKLVVACVAGLAMDSRVEMGENYTPPEPSLASFFLAFTILAFVFWGFRFLWLYIPVVFGYRMLFFLEKAHGYGFSFTILGVWLICFIPLGFTLASIAEILYGVFPQEAGPEGVEDSDAYVYSLLALQALVETTVATITTMAIGSGIHQMLRGRDGKGLV